MIIPNDYPIAIEIHIVIKMTTICDKCFANDIHLKTVVLLFYQSVCAGNYCQAT